MKKVITYGTYDHLHYGHINLLKNARELGDYLIVGVTSDEFDRYRGKINVHQPLLERIAALEETGLADQIIVEEYEGQKIVDIQKYNVDIFTVGSDWVGHFDYLNEYCDVVYLPRTEGVSSTELRANSRSTLRIGVVGSHVPAQRFIAECKAVRECLVTGIFSKEENEAKKIADETEIEQFADREALYDSCNAVAVMEMDLSLHAEIIGDALTRGKHVLCEGPLFLRTEEAKHWLTYAKEHNLTLFDAVKTRHFPGYRHMLLLAKSGKIGEIKDVDVTFSQLTKGVDYSKIEKYKGGLYRLGGYLFSPILQLLGRAYEDVHIYTHKAGEYDTFTRGFVKYPHATASFKAGLGIKTEGQLIITGTEGYIFVPSPWWKPDYFEIRYEDLRDTEKYFWQYVGEGFRYEILDFLEAIFQGKNSNSQFGAEDVLTLTEIIDEYAKGNHSLF